MSKTKQMMIWGGVILMALMVSSCAGGGTAKSNATIADIQGKDWVLDEVKTGSSTVTIDRTGDTRGIYTLRFEVDRVSGMGAPNRYFSPYTSGEGQVLSIGNVAGTLMAPLFENKDLKEQDYFKYLGKVNRWNVKDGLLELYTTAENGAQVTLIYY